VQFFQSVMYHYSEEWGGLLRGMGRPLPRSGAAYSEEKGVRPENPPPLSLLSRPIPRSGAYARAYSEPCSESPRIAVGASI
jgi:hypothetical protein